MKWNRVIIIILLGVFIYSSYNLANYFYNSYLEKAAYDDLRRQFEQQLQDSDEPSTGGQIPTNSPPDIDLPILKRYEQLLDINEDVVGWITIPGTNINYPVVKTDDNKYYLDRNIYREKAKAGAIFMDYRNDPAARNRNTIIYGHHMRDGSMFTALMKYKKKNFFNENNIIKFDTLYEEIEWEIFSAYIVTGDNSYMSVSFADDEKFMDFLDKIKGKSLYKKDIDLTADDQILTLSTCTYEYDNARFVVHARRIRTNE